MLASIQSRVLNIKQFWKDILAVSFLNEPLIIDLLFLVAVSRLELEQASSNFFWQYLKVAFNSS